MNKRASLSAKSATPLNYPDVLGTFTEGKRFNLDVLQLAAATRPMASEAGKPFDAIVLLQNAASIDVDAVIRLLIPGADLAGQKNRFSTSLVKPIRIGLRPAEVGFVNLPLLCTVQTKPGSYALQVELQVEQKQRGASRVRDANGGTPFSISDIPDDRRPDYESIQGLTYSIAPTGRVAGNKAALTIPFTVLPAALADLPQDIKPNYVSLWTIADYPDEAALVEKSRSLTAAILPQLNRSSVFFPLLQATQEHFERADFRLWAGEAVMVAKLMTLVLEMGVPQPEPGQESVVYPHWFIRLCRILVRNPQEASHLEQLVTHSLYADLLYDAAMLGFAMLSTVTKEQFGTIDKSSAYAADLVASLNGKGQPLDLRHAYLPLVLAGLISNTRISMPQEQIRDTVSLLVTAREKRAAQLGQQGDNATVFKVADDLIDRALEHF